MGLRKSVERKSCVFYCNEKRYVYNDFMSSQMRNAYVRVRECAMHFTEDAHWTVDQSNAFNHITVITLVFSVERKWRFTVPN